jgi:hypothetical protein
MMFSYGFGWMRGLKEYAFFTEVRSKWTIGNRYLYYIANEEKKAALFCFGNLMSNRST